MFEHIPGSLTELFIEITDKCFLTCRHCSTQASENGACIIHINDVIKLIDDSHPLGLEQVALSGGEPFSYPDLSVLIEQIKARQLQLTIYSCGVLKADGRLIPLPQDLLLSLKGQVNKLIFSLHGLKETHDEITGEPGSFEAVERSIVNAVNADLPVEIHCVPMSVNFNEISAVVDHLYHLGIRKISLLRLVPQGRCRLEPQLLLTLPQSVIIARSIDILEQCHPGLRVRFGSPFNCIQSRIGARVTRCTAAEKKLLISATGEVFPCEAFKFLRGQRPTIYNTSIEQIWHQDSLLKKLRRSKGTPIMNCQGCNHFTSCQGGCPGQRMLVNGTIETGPDPLCLYNGDG